MNGKIIKDAAVLMLITLAAGIMLGFVYEITKKPIADQREIAKQEAFKAVFEDAAEFKTDEAVDLNSAPEILAAEGYTANVIEEVLAAVDANGKTLGYVMNVTSKEGYGDDITFSMGIRLDGTVNGIEILSISETAGLGMKAAEEPFKGQFAGKLVEAFKYTKTGAAADDEIDAISGATITTSAMTNGVNAGITFFNSMTGEGK